MKLNFQFSNLLGSVYKDGNILFTPDGNSVISPVGNRISVFEIIQNKSFTFPFENSKNIKRIALSPNSTLLISIDEDGRALLINFKKRVVLHRHNFKEPVLDIKFSPNGKLIAVTHGKYIQLWKTPGFTMDFAPFVLYKTFGGHYDDVTTLNWSFDSKFLVSGSKDMTSRIYSLEVQEPLLETQVAYIPAVLSGHKDNILGAWFSNDSTMVYTVSRDGALFQWSCETMNQEPNEIPSKKQKTKIKKIPASRVTQKWKITSKNYFMQNQSKVVSCSFHASLNLLTVGFSTGIFSLYELPDFINIHSLSISQKKIDSVCVSPSGEWIAFGCSKLGQLLVWEWQSETHVLKQQGHLYNMNCLSYSQDGQFIATGGEDGKVKLWSTQSGFCFVTFAEHTSSVTAVEFAKQGQVVFTSSMDGTIRAFDLVRYRNFRTFTSPTPVQFSCLAVDTSGEIVCAGSSDSYEIFMWSVQTGKLLEIFSGHEGPISSLSFSPIDGSLASCSWDRSLRIWNLFNRDITPEIHLHDHEILTLAYRPDGRHIATTTLDGQIHFWDLQESILVSSIEGRNDIGGGRKSSDRMTAANSASGKSFTSICYTSDGKLITFNLKGNFIIGGGTSKYICIYNITSSALLKRFQITNNQSLEGMKEFLNSKNMTAAGPIDLIDDTSDKSDLEDRLETKLPGVIKGDPSLRKTKPESKTTCVKFSPTGRSWGATTTEGLMIYSLDDCILFDPFDLTMEITEESIKETFSKGDYLLSLIMSFRLGEHHLTKYVFDRIPSDDCDLMVRQIPVKYLERIIKFLVLYSEQNVAEKRDALLTPLPFRIEYYLTWVLALLKYHGEYLRDHNSEYSSCIRSLSKSIQDHERDLYDLCQGNIYMMEFFKSKMQNKMTTGEDNLLMGDDKLLTDNDNDYMME